MESPVYLDLQIATRTNITLAQKDVVAYLVKTISHYKDKEILVIPFNMGKHWTLLSVSTKYYQVWYCDSSMLIDSKTGN
jgi:hypothetical protein